MFTNVDANEFVMPGKEPRQREAACGFSGFVLRNVFSEHAFVALQMPFAIRPLGEPVGNPDLRVDRAGAHGDAGLIAGGGDLSRQSWLLQRTATRVTSMVTFVDKEYPLRSANAGFMPTLVHAVFLDAP